MGGNGLGNQRGKIKYKELVSYQDQYNIKSI